MLKSWKFWEYMRDNPIFFTYDFYGSFYFAMI